MKTKQLDAVVKSKVSDSPNGRHCFFVPINDRWGIKLYTEATNRDEAHLLQSDAADHGLAPKVGGQVNLPCDWEVESGHYCYGYITEIAKPIFSYCYRNTDDWGFSYEQAEQWREDHQDEMQDYIKELLDTIDWNFTDTYHIGNWGRLENGKLVCIDFGTG